MTCDTQSGPLKGLQATPSGCKVNQDWLWYVLSPPPEQYITTRSIVYPVCMCVASLLLCARGGDRRPSRCLEYIHAQLLRVQAIRGHPGFTMASMAYRFGVRSWYDGRESQPCWRQPVILLRFGHFWDPRSMVSDDGTRHHKCTPTTPPPPSHRSGLICSHATRCISPESCPSIFYRY